MSEDRGLGEVLKQAGEAWEEARKYLEIGGDVTYAYLRLALKDLKAAEPLLVDGYCRKQVKAEVELLEHALNLAMIAFQWNLGAGGFRGKLRLWLRAVKEAALILLIQLKKL